MASSNEEHPLELDTICSISYLISHVNLLEGRDKGDAIGRLQLELESRGGESSDVNDPNGGLLLWSFRVIEYQTMCHWICFCT